tara:strand:- start:613 stop:1839 length:1227 start_codon:yes stop_codon:yes gene_type:complete
MSATLNLGTDGEWATRENSLLSYNDENGNYKPLPFDFTRASSATVVNKAGLIETVGTGTPRIDFSDDVNGALLLEPQRTNLVTYSNDFSNVAWVKNAVSITINNITSPDGIQNADLFTADGTNVQHYVLQSQSSSAKTMSIFAKAGTQQFIQILTSGTASPVANYDLINGTTNLVGSSSTTSIENYGNGWYRCILTTTDAAAGSFYVCFSQSLATGRFPSFVSSKTLYLWGGQSEANTSYPTSYIPTQGSTVTRNLETCTGAGNDQVINSTEGVLYAEIAAEIITSFKNLSINDSTSSNRINLYIYNSSLTVNFDVGGVNQASISYTIPDVTTFNKIAFSYKLNEFKLFVNGVQRGSTDTSGTVPAVGTFNKLSFNDGSLSKFYGNTKDIRVYNTALTDAELQALTTI